MLDLYHALISTPLLNILVGLYETVAFRDLGIAIAFLTVLVRLAFYPLFQRGLEQQAKMQELQPKIKEIQKKHKGDHEAHSKALLALYKEEKFNPFSGIFMMLVQIPILLALYYLFLSLFKDGALDKLYSFIPDPGTLNQIAFGFIDLSQPYFLLVVFTAILQFVQTRIALSSAPNMDKAQRITGQIMSYAVPIITLVIFLNLPAAVSVYWLVSSLLSVAQQYHAKVKMRRKNAAKAA